MLRSTLCVFGTILAGKAAAEPPKVATDIAPVHSLVARVMSGVSEPALIIPPSASPHDHAMRPSEARALQSADVVFWVGEELTPWMEKPLEALSGNAQQIALLEVDGTTLHEFRDVVEEDDHDDHAGHGDHAEHDDHAEKHDDHAGHDEKHDDHAGHEDHAEHADHAGHEDHADHDDHAGHDHGHGHDHDGVDPHAWLDPENARVWVHAIADTLAKADPENAETYKNNAKAADAELHELVDQISAEVENAKDRAFITFHDAYQYFEKRFGLNTSGSVSLGDASNPGPARLAALQEKVADDKIVCAFSEPQYDMRLVETAIEGTGAKIYDLDPVGTSIDPGPDHYPNLLRAMAVAFQNCATGS